MNEDVLLKITQGEICQEQEYTDPGHDLSDHP
jgi:hypothetical protein